MLPTIEYETLRDFSGLDTIRQSCASRSNGIQVDDLSISAFEGLDSLKSRLPEGSLMKKDTSKSPSSSITAVMEACHKLSHEVSKNLSHALELPWEKCLGEMHEFTAPSMDRLNTFLRRESQFTMNGRLRQSSPIQHIHSQQRCRMAQRSPSLLKAPRR